MSKISFILAAFTFILTPYFVSAGPILRSSETISVDANQVLQSDFYGLAQKISISGQAEHDVYLGGLKVTINAPIQEDVSIVGGSVQIHAEVGDDVRIVAGEVTIGDRVKGDVVVYGGSLHILSTAHIEGDLIYSGESLLVDGDVDGSIHGLSNKIRINSRIVGDIEYVGIDSFSLGEKAEVVGSISYESKNELARNPSAVVGGDIQKTDILPDKPEDLFKSLLYMFMVLVFAGLTLYFLGKRYVQSFTISATTKLGQNGLLGIALLIFAPLVAFVFMVSVVGMLVGTVFILAYIAALILSTVLASIIFGYYAQIALTKKKKITIQTVILGSVISGLLLFIPVIGPLTIFAASMVSLGALGRTAHVLVRS